MKIRETDHRAAAEEENKQTSPSWSPQSERTDGGAQDGGALHTHLSLQQPQFKRMTFQLRKPLEKFSNPD